MAVTTQNIFEYAGNSFWHRSDGTIACDTCGLTWCDHVTEMIVNNGDAEYLWSMLPEMQAIQVPVFPTSELWARVDMEYQADLEAYRVYYIKNEDGDGVRLGYLHQGEGRNIIRSLILDWFEGQPYRLSCKSSSHKMVQQQNWDSAMVTRNRRLLNRWSVWTNNICIACTKDFDFDDLIPDASSTRRSPF